MAFRLIPRANDPLNPLTMPFSQPVIPRREIAALQRVYQTFVGLISRVLERNFTIARTLNRVRVARARASHRQFGACFGGGPQYLQLFSNVFEIPSEKITMGHGEYVVFRNNHDDKTSITRECFDSVYQIVDKYSPGKLIKNFPVASDLDGILSKRYESIVEEVKRIDPQLEVVFVPRTLYEVIFLRKAIKEDIKRETACPYLLGKQRTRDVSADGFTRGCWHLCFFNNPGDNSKPEVKEIAYRVNRVMIKTLDPESGGFTHKELIERTDHELKFLKSYYVKRKECDRANHGSSRSFSIGPACYFGYYSHPGPMAIENEEDAQIVRNAVSVECSSVAQRAALLYRGSVFRLDEPFSLTNPSHPHSLSYGTSLFAGSLYDPWGTAFNYAKRHSDAYVLTVPFDQIDQSAFYIPTTNAICQLAGSGESFHCRTKLWADVDTHHINGIDPSSSASDISGILQSNLSRTTLIINFQETKRGAIFLKPGRFVPLQKRCDSYF